MILRTEGLTKTFEVGLRRKRVHAVEDLTLSVNEGEIFGFVGPNGAGKTTTIKMLSGLIFPTAGRAFIFDAPIPSQAAKARIGYRPSTPPTTSSSLDARPCGSSPSSPACRGPRARAAARSSSRSWGSRASFVCICDKSKLVPVLGRFPLPVEVIPMARSHVGREMVRRKAQPVLRENYRTDNGNLILDCWGLTIIDPPALEAELNDIAGVVTNGIFARRGAGVLLLGEENGVRTISKAGFRGLHR